MNIAFWNIASKEDKKKTADEQKDITDTIVQFILERDIDIICLAESRNQLILSIIKQIFDITGLTYNHVLSSKEKVSIISFYDLSVFEDKGGLYPSPRWAAHYINLPSIIELNLISVHFPSKVDWPASSQALECVNLSRDIQLIEKETKCINTVVIGDFNMNPFEDGMVAANGLNAVSDLDYASDNPKGREINKEHYRYFYNPMWNFFGDSKKTPGTHYYRTSGHVSHEWNMYDQVIIRPSLKDYLTLPCVDIIKKIHTSDLTAGKYGRPDSAKFSDHLPIILRINT
ncbi:endonuclease/exonuclease/phosphatase family protein [Hymenobacter koreensis]|uniref:Endonuclease/exonuclease/phosphatase domain-containing protein n=1 Tax=Hymenobacter koreensis TaxID=1084523 RepID=A0ABP8JD24_9BACT